MASTKLYYANQYFTTTLSVVGGIDDSQTTGIVLSGVSGLDITKAGIALINYADPLNTSTAEWVTYTSINGSNELQGVTRGAEGFSAKAHSNGVTIAFPVSEAHINNLNAMFDTTGLDIAEISTPTNPDSGRNKLYFKSDGELYKINSSGTESSISSGSGADGWTAVSVSWSYASASTVTVPSGAASLYKIGDKVKFTQTTVKYFVITAVADTVLTFAVNTDYTVANATISLIYYSHVENPIGWPSFFAFTPGSITGWSATPTVNIARFGVFGRLCHLRVDITGTSNATSVSFTVPVSAANSGTVESNFVLTLTQDNGSFLTTPGRASLNGTTMTIYKDHATGAWTGSNTKRVQLNGTYEI